MKTPKNPQNMENFAVTVTRWLGSIQSVILHTIIFILSFIAVYAGFIPFDRMLLVLTTAVSLEAIYLSIFIQITLNYTKEDVVEIQEDIDEIQEDVEEISEDVDEIQEDIDELQEDVEEVSEEVLKDDANSAETKDEKDTR